MNKIIQFLVENKNILDLLKAGNISLIGVNELETQAILDAFEEDLKQQSTFWS
ncbi:MULTISPECIES: competence pheromone ComX [Lysinibacillus]|uniref:ComX pheromone n=1 Tax=Lysinibacillus antri TaxID=2498145 RepID=A0A432LAE9_9BACI|nr:MULTISPECIES: competence pheromone ComX [Lysinibacillus]RUL51312.1 competence pheromone ComX [Lysinibacillus antri]TSI05119.1 competence pheromone ComX [Lysinibacillus sp. BW-2-10]